MEINVYGDVYLDSHKQQPKIKKENGVVINTTKKKVKSRDGFCQCCMEDGNGHLEVHHIFPRSKYPSMANEEGNMIALCQRCHRKYHDMYDIDDVNAVTFSKYLKDYGNRRY